MRTTTFSLGKGVPRGLSHCARLLDFENPTHRIDSQNDVLMLRFNRQEFKDTVVVGESIEIKITGKWEDGTEFETCDSIRVVERGK